MLIRSIVSSGICSVKSVEVLTDERAQINSAKMSDFFELAAVNSKSNSYRITIHLDYFPPNN